MERGQPPHRAIHVDLVRMTAEGQSAPQGALGVAETLTKDGGLAFVAWAGRSDSDQPGPSTGPISSQSLERIGRLSIMVEGLELHDPQRIESEASETQRHCYLCGFGERVGELTTAVLENGVLVNLHAACMIRAKAVTDALTPPERRPRNDGEATDALIVAMDEAGVFPSYDLEGTLILRSQLGAVFERGWQVVVPEPDEDNDNDGLMVEM